MTLVHRWGNRVALATAVLALLGSSSASFAANIFWDNTSGNWNTPGNWLGDVPSAPDHVFIGNTPAAENAFVTLNVSSTISALSITDGMVLNSNGQILLVMGDVTISGENLDGNISFPSRLQVKPSGNVLDVDVDNLTVTAGGGIDMEGGILEVDNVLLVAGPSNVYGDGVIRFTGSNPRVYINDGILQAGIDGLVLNQNGTGRIDLDGNTGSGRVFVSTSSIPEQKVSHLTINGDALSDSFSGQIQLAGGGSVTMNLSGGEWSTDATSEIIFFPAVNNPNGTAMINGADVAFGGLLTTYGIAEINANSRYNNTAIVDIRTDDELRLDGAAVFAGASFVQTQAATGGIISNNGGVTVVSNTTVDLPTGVFDWDGNPGNAVTTIEPGVTFTLNVDAIENDLGSAPTQSYNGSTTVGNGGTLAIHTTEAWRHDGTVTLNNAILTGSGIVNFDLLQGSGQLTPASLDNQGTISAQNGTLIVETSGVNDLDGSNGEGVLSAVFGNLRVQGINNLASFSGTLHAGFQGTPFEFHMPTGGLDNTGEISLFGGTYRAGLRQDGTLDVGFDSKIVSDGTFGSDGANTVNAELELEGDFLVETGAGFNGTGKIVLHPETVLSAQHMATIGVHLDSFGRVEPGNSPGQLNLVEFTNEETGVLAIELMSSGGMAGIDHDLVDVRGSALLLGGRLDVSFLDGFTPSLGDEFLVLQTLTGVTGTFAEVIQPSLPGGVSLIAVYDEYTVRLVAVVPEPSTLLLAACGLGLLALRRRG